MKYSFSGNAQYTEVAIMRNFIYHCRRIKRRLSEISEITDLTLHERKNILAELANYDQYMSGIDIRERDYFWNEYCDIWDDLKSIEAAIRGSNNAYISGTTDTF